MTAIAVRPAPPVMHVRVRRPPSRAEQLIRFMHLYHREHGYWPRLTEMLEPLGLKGTSSVLHWLRQYVHAGYILPPDELQYPGLVGLARQYRPNYQRLHLETQAGVMTVWERE